MCKNRRSIAATIAWILLASNGHVAAQTTELYDRLSDHLAAREAALVEIRHDIHRHPELSGSERRTAGIVAGHLENLGFDVRPGVGGHGVIGVLRGGKPGPMVAFRADMDAVRSADHDPVDFRSLTPGVRHICGHDLHTTIGLGIAEGFAAIADRLPGSVMLIFQPAEETASGAKAMLADEAFATHKPDAIYAVHTAPYAVGQVATALGAMMAGRARVSVTITGSGDLQAAASAVQQAIEGVGNVQPGAEVQPGPPGFMLARASAGPNVEGGGLVVNGQVTTAGTDSRARARTLILEAVGAIVSQDVAIKTDYDEFWIAGVTNDTALTTAANDAIAELAPDIEVLPVRSIIPAFSEDFGSFQAEVPGVMYFLGVSNPTTGTVGMPHSPDYVADDAAILIGARAISSAMLIRLSAE